jgi:hypothetical protein
MTSTNNVECSTDVKEWWNEAQGQSNKAITSLAMLVSWEVWKEWNARVFRNNTSTTMMVITKIKEEQRTLEPCQG